MLSALVDSPDNFIGQSPDNFKLVNDVHGHHRGDEALISLARFFRKNSRLGDAVARFGGDEFAMWLDGIDQESVKKRTHAMIEDSAIFKKFSGDENSRWVCQLACRCMIQKATKISIVCSIAPMKQCITSNAKAKEDLLLRNLIRRQTSRLNSPQLMCRHRVR